MKVLWFSLSPGLSDGYLNNNYEGIGWIKSLEKNIQNKVDLSIAFYHHKKVAPFKLGATTYYPIEMYRNGNLTKIQRRLLNAIETEHDIQLLLEVIKEVKPDLIHIHGTEGAFGLVQKYNDIPTVVSIQGTITVYQYKFFSKISWFDVMKYSKLKNILFSRTFIHVYKLFKKMAAREQDIYRNSNHFIGRTAWDRRVTKVLAPSARYYHNDEILRNGFYTNKWSFKPAAKLQLFTTIWGNIYKGLETLLDCASLLDNINLDYEWHVAGIRLNDEIVQIASKGNKHPVSANIKFGGMISEQKLIEGLLHSHIYIATSHIENSPNSLCEALILGVPCIATNAGGTGSLMEDNKEGILIQDGDPYAMAGAIMELQDNYDKAIGFGAKACERALLRHDQEKITNDLLSIYRTILEKPHTFSPLTFTDAEKKKVIAANN
ncbi:glycosyltransferase [Mucilaginibacter sp.]|uniref:glycosyltransferase family 4 protein n=1 Tax=Mucilaginibacter sp. TaxID=1882438 RepID=UPI00262A9C7E|nr:glycosyltransferase [Mucilaginibacter sp.]